MEYKHFETVKEMLGITGTYQDGPLKGYITEVKSYMEDAGVEKSVIESESAVGVIARGVSDLWNYGSGGTKLSEYFKERCIQLAYKEGEKNV